MNGLAVDVIKTAMIGVLAYYFLGHATSAIFVFIAALIGLRKAKQIVSNKLGPEDVE